MFRIILNLNQRTRNDYVTHFSHKPSTLFNSMQLIQSSIMQLHTIKINLTTQSYTLKSTPIKSLIQKRRSFSTLKTNKQSTKNLFFGPENSSHPYKWKTDDILAVFSWIFVSHSLFLLLGTTTFVSTLLFLSNSLSFQEYIAEKVKY